MPIPKPGLCCSTPVSLPVELESGRKVIVHRTKGLTTAAGRVCDPIAVMAQATKGDRRRLRRALRSQGHHDVIRSTLGVKAGFIPTGE